MDPNILKAVEKWASLQNKREELVKELEKTNFEISQLEKDVPQLGNIKGILGGGTKKKKKKEPKEKEEEKEPPTSEKTPAKTSPSPEKTASNKSPQPRGALGGKRPGSSEKEKEASKKMRTLKEKAASGTSVPSTSTDTNLQIFS